MTCEKVTTIQQNVGRIMFETVLPEFWQGLLPQVAGHTNRPNSIHSLADQLATGRYDLMACQKGIEFLLRRL